MSTYSTVKINGVIISIGKITDIRGYTETIIEAFLPSNIELEKMKPKQINKWTVLNNRRMEAICKFLNENNL